MFNQSPKAFDEIHSYRQDGIFRTYPSGAYLDHDSDRMAVLVDYTYVQLVAEWNEMTNHKLVKGIILNKHLLMCDYIL